MKLISRIDAAKKLGIGASAFLDYIKKGLVPDYYCIDKSVSISHRWLLSDIENSVERVKEYKALSLSKKKQLKKEKKPSIKIQRELWATALKEDVFNVFLFAHTKAIGVLKND